MIVTMMLNAMGLLHLGIFTNILNHPVIAN